MKIVCGWLKEVVDIHVPAEELADALTGAGLEVASLRNIRLPERVVVGKVLTVAKHPNADRLSVCTVDAGMPAPLTIVCGAPNVAAAMLAPLALEGAVLGPDFTVRQSKIRGVASFGMLCSGKELGLSDDDGGLLALPAECKPGEPLSTLYPDDAVIEIEIVPSRGDCLSIIGVAREVAARYGLPLKSAARLPQERADDPVAAAISVDVEAVDACPRYAGRLVRGVTIRPSPDWMKRRLLLAGLRPINNVVDVTNYILLQFGQPLHAFDYRLIGGKHITVRKALHPTEFTTLDGTKRTLVADDLLICDAERPVALAGIMGGAGSAITDATTEVFIECAFFSQNGIRRTAKRLGLSTDASYRFERGVDPGDGLIDALDTAAALIAELGNGTTACGRIDCYPQRFERRVVRVRTSRVKKVLGHAFSREKIAGFLTSIGLLCEVRDDDTMACTIPLFRHDLLAEEDLIEEVGRLHGYDAIVAATDAHIPLRKELPAHEEAADLIRHSLAYAGFNETVTNSFTSEQKRLRCTPERHPVVLLNPLSPDMAQMRTTMAGSLLDVLAYNLNRKNRNNKFFELGRIYEALPGDKRREVEVLAILMEGDWMPATWHAAALPCDFFTLKGALAGFAAHIGNRTAAADLRTAPAGGETVLFGREAVSFTIGDSIHGSAGGISPTVLDYFGIKTPVYYAEMEITDFLDAPSRAATFRPLPRFPAVEWGLCFVMDDTISSAAIVHEMAGVSPLIEEVLPTDLFQNEKIGGGKKSVAFSVVFRSPEKTLTAAEAQVVAASIIKRVEIKFNAKLRE
jgi:phenylalanyl-tRNA synthetase beta chain